MLRATALATLTRIPIARPQARSCDWRFQRLYVAQQERLSTVQTIFGFYDRSCPFSPALIELLDGMLQINPRRRLSMSDVAASAWLTPARFPHLNLDLATMGASSSSLVSGAHSPVGCASSPYNQMSPGMLDSESELAITAGDDANFADPAILHEPFPAPAKACFDDGGKGRRRYALDLESDKAVLCPR
jgi:serine/threonine protein kinase